MHPFVYTAQPARVIFGAGSLSQLAREIDALHLVLASASDRDIAVLNAFAGLVKSDPGLVSGVVAVARRFDALRDVAADSPSVAAWVDRVVDVMGEFIGAHATNVAETGLSSDLTEILDELLGASLSPAQERAANDLIRRVEEHTPVRSADGLSGQPKR